MRKERKACDHFKILSIDGSRVYKTAYSVRDADGRIDPSRFEGVLDASLETYKLEEVYGRHKEFREKFRISSSCKKGEICDPTPITLALIDLSFESVVKAYRERKKAKGIYYVRQGYALEEVISEMKDHVLVKDGEIVAIEVPHREDDLSLYPAVEVPLDPSMLAPYFTYGNGCYKRTETAFPQVADTVKVRRELYENGFFCDGVHYVRYKRSAGSSRNGQCLFIPETLYDEMMEWSSCGIDGDKIEDKASFQAYIALTLSSTKERIRLSKRSILILEDQTSTFREKVVRVHRNEEDTLDAEIGDAEITNKIWDGEALMDESVFEEYGLAEKGMMLLRNRFFKTCAFNTKLQKWFHDQGITDVKQLNGYCLRGAKLSDIKLVITESSLKYCKMMKGTLKEKFEAWVSHVFEGNSSDFGLVKTEMKTKPMGGKMVVTSYQMLNTIGLTEEETAKFLEPSFDYLHHIMQDPMYLRHYIRLQATDDGEIDDPTTTDYRAQSVLKALKANDEFADTVFFSEFRGDLIGAFKEQMKRGRIRVDGTNATLFGNGAELLTAVTKKGYRADAPVALKGNEVRTTAFSYDIELLCARSPHITMGNLFVAKNVDNDIYANYFNFAKAHEIVCVNAIGHNLQQRLNGCDYDSDTMLITDSPLLLEAAKRDQDRFPVPVADLGTEDVGDSRHLDLAELDRQIAENRIGEIVNLSQFLNSMYWDRVACGAGDAEALYADICKLAVLSGLEIDKAKRACKVRTASVLNALSKRKQEYKKAHQGKLPPFFLFLTGEKVKASPADADLRTTMSYIYNAVLADKERAPRSGKKSIASLIAAGSGKGNNDTRKRDAIIEAAKELKKSVDKYNMKKRQLGKSARHEGREALDAAFEAAMAVAAKNLVNDHVLDLIIAEIDKADNAESRKVSSERYLLFAVVLFEEGDRLSKRMRKSASVQYDLRLSPSGDIHIYGHPHRKVCAKGEQDVPFVWRMPRLKENE